MNLFRCTDIEDASLIEFLQNAGKNLIHLNLYQCERIAGSLVAKAIPSCQNLQEVILSDCEKVNNEDVIAVADHCPNLKTLFLTACNLVTDQAVIYLSERAHELETVGFPRGITDAAIST